MFRSLIVPVKAAAGFLLSVGASFGATVAVFQWGWLAGPFGITTGPIASYLPIVLMAVLFGLAMDYEVFLVSRIREDYIRGGDPRQAIIAGGGAAARVVVAASVIMTCIFASFLPSADATIKSLALALAVGVACDALVVRMTIVPAVLALVGQRAWRIPRWLDRLCPTSTSRAPQSASGCHLLPRLPLLAEGHHGGIVRMSDERWIAEPHGGIDSLRLVPVRVPAPRGEEVTIAVCACGMNPIDYKNLPSPIGFEVAGVIIAAGPGTRHEVGDEVLAFRIEGGYATALTVPGRDAFTKPAELTFPQAANLLLTGTAAAEMLHLTHIGAGDTVLVHGAGGAVGVSVLQQLRDLGANAIGTASEAGFATVREFGATPISYGPGLAERVRRLAGAGLSAALDCVGTHEAIDVSLELVRDRDRIVTTAAAYPAACSMRRRRRRSGSGFRQSRTTERTNPTRNWHDGPVPPGMLPWPAAWAAGLAGLVSAGSEVIRR